MYILSLFDGISCGRVALDRAAIPVTRYYSSEIDKFAIQVSQKNYPDIILLGDVTKWRTWILIGLKLIWCSQAHRVKPFHLPANGLILMIREVNFFYLCGHFESYQVT